MIWYQTQERAMAPGIADGWPEVIPAPHTVNGRLVRREGPSPDEQAARIRELEAAVSNALAAMYYEAPNWRAEAWRILSEAEGGK